MITKSEWLKALKEAEDPELADGKTIRELCGLLGWGKDKVSGRLLQGMADGSVIKGGRATPKGRVAVYKIKGGKKNGL